MVASTDVQRSLVPGDVKLVERVSRWRTMLCRSLHGPDAGGGTGHGVATLLPYQPARLLAGTEGKTPTANWEAREQAWPRVVDFLADPN